ncbi:MAG: hypothetical protein AMXMBFR84_25680 [Candidatus Hydrogenedentota bacterium]
MSRRTGLVVVLALLCLGLGLTPYFAQRGLGKTQTFEEPQLPVLWQAPNFTLTGPGGVPFDSESLKGKIWVVDFFLTSCEGACPVMASNFKKLYKAFENDSRVHFVSITTDPDVDNPDVLSQYAERYQADTSRWHFLTGPKAELDRLMGEQGFKVGVPETPMAHTQRFLLVDSQGNLRSLYSGVEDQSIPLLTADINLLIQDWPQ